MINSFVTKRLINKRNIFKHRLFSFRKISNFNQSLMTVACLLTLKSKIKKNSNKCESESDDEDKNIVANFRDEGELNYSRVSTDLLSLNMNETFGRNLNHVEKSTSTPESNHLVLFCLYLPQCKLYHRFLSPLNRASKSFFGLEPYLCYI
ncbi:hypothetical protein BpHYR1_048160 [Brachionus plicatilis]|uniref:Uncharacterized protein n=1 Tax=Brachionus plicatilis TaxID=10195 RepID=A0A3M7PQK8_BRAPC|nr:hypothetical protein BpHYR1_048160 [Brachionus plicatilis]